MKQQNPEITNKRLISTPTSIDRQDNILTLIGPVLVGIFVLISTVSALVSLSAACASIAVAEELSDSTPSISLVCQINMAARLFILEKKIIPQKFILHLIGLENFNFVTVQLHPNQDEHPCANYLFLLALLLFQWIWSISNIKLYKKLYNDLKTFFPNY